MLAKKLTSSMRLLLALVLIACCVGCDQATKVLATRTLRGEEPRSYLGNTFRLEYAQNPGGFLSLGAFLPPQARFGLFVAVNAVLAGVLLFGRMTLGIQIAVLFIFAGGASNLIDRVFNDGLVIDFMNLGIGPLRTGIFNVADMALMFGAVAVVILHGRSKTETEPQAEASARGDC
jgi:signal peptidase II